VMVSFLVFLALAAVSDGRIYATVTSSLQAWQPPQAFCQIVPSTGQQQGLAPFPASVGGFLPGGFVTLPSTNEGAVLTVGTDECVVFFSLSNASVTGTLCSATLVLDNIAVFNNTVWVVAYNESASENFLFSVDRLSGTFQQEMHLPGVINVATSAYSDRLFYLTTQTQGGAGNNLTVVDVVERRIVSQVRVEPAIEILVYGGRSAGLLAWVATSVYAGQLVVLDPATGKTVKIIVSSVTLSANGGSSAYDPTTGNVYAVLLAYQSGEAPVWTVTHLATGVMQRFPVSPDAQYPWAVGLAVV